MTITREGIFLLGFAILVLYAIVMIFKKVKPVNFFINLAFGLYLLMIVAICFFPLRIKGGGIDMLNSFIPFKSTIASLKESISNHTPYGLISVFGNLIMLMPLGIFFDYYISERKRRMFGTFLFSVAIETVQFIIGMLIGFNYRSIDIDDVILNTLGGIIACIVFDSIIKKIKAKRT